MVREATAAAAGWYGHETSSLENYLEDSAAIAAAAAADPLLMGAH